MSRARITRRLAGITGVRFPHNLAAGVRFFASRGWRLFGEEWPEVQEPFTRGILANQRQPTTSLDAAQARFRDALRRLVPDSTWFSFDADALEYFENAGYFDGPIQLETEDLASQGRLSQRQVPGKNHRRQCHV